MKVCTKCGEFKPLESFYRQKKTKDGRRTKCAECTRIYYKSYYQANKADWYDSKARDYEYFRRYGITLDQYEEVLRNQDGVCAICKGNRYPKERLCVDHDHKTKIVRGLLCRICNMGLGKFDDLGLARNLVTYLETQ